MKVGLHISHEQFAPSHLLKLAQMAEEASFQSVLSSDHFHPWSLKQGNSGLSWAWLGAAMATTRLEAGVVCSPGQRWHPAIVAQAAATLEEMFPGRFWLALGSGQLLNEGITGQRWPIKAQRQERVLECVNIIRPLWSGQTVTHIGLTIVEEATLHTRPSEPPPLLAAAISPQTAEWAAQWADGLITVSQPREKMQAVVAAFRRGGGGDKPMFLKVQLSYASTDDEALAGAVNQWRAPILDSTVQTMLRTPQQFDAAVEHIPPDIVRQYVRVSSDLDRHLAWLNEDAEMGFQHLLLHNVNRNQEQFVESFGQKLLPQLR